MEYLGHSTFPDCCKVLCTQTDNLYNAKNMLKSNNLDLSSTGGKLPPHGPRRVLVPSRKFSDPYVLSVRRRFLVSDQEKRHYNAICKLSESSKWHRYSFLYIYFYSFCIMHVSYFAFLFISFFFVVMML